MINVYEKVVLVFSCLLMCAKQLFLCCTLHDKCCKDTFEVLLGGLALGGSGNPAPLVARKMLFILDNTLS